LKSLLPWLEQERVPIYFLGGREEVLRTVLGKLQIVHPRLAIAGARNGYFQQAEETTIVDDINESGAAILFVAIGSPRQEFFIEKYRSALQPRVAMGVGGSFDVLAGIKRDAPAWTQHGIEWLYRLWQDPRNLWKRYLRAHPWFIYHTLREKLSRVVNPPTHQTHQ
jgi:N-acetylglucosaminyldiphosphoundecaprenol N-acetyl-beta-D-mannosaminyltransferase